MLQCRLVLRGLRFADGNQGEAESDAHPPLIYTSSCAFAMRFNCWLSMLDTARAATARCACCPLYEKKDAERLKQGGRGVLRCRGCCNEVHARCVGRQNAVPKRTYFCRRCKRTAREKGEKTKPKDKVERRYVLSVSLRPCVHYDKKGVQSGQLEEPMQVWFVCIPHEVHLIFVRRAGEEGTKGHLLSASRPVIIGSGDSR